MSYAALSPEKKAPALALLANLPSDAIHSAYAQDAENWFRAPAMRLWFLALKQLLRSRGFDEHYFGGELDDILVPLAKEALILP